MKNPGHDVFINEAVKLEEFMDDLLSKTLISFVEAKVIKARFIRKLVTDHSGNTPGPENLDS